MKKRIVSFVLVLCLVVSLLPGTAFAAGDTVTYPVEGGSITFDKSTGTVTAADMSITSATIPEMIDGVAVTAISGYAFQGHSQLVSVEILANLTELDRYAFSSCTVLKSVKLPEGLISIGNRAFYACKNLSDINLPDSITSIDAEVFSGCESLKNIHIPTSMSSIGNKSFAGCTGLTEVTIPVNIQALGEYAFWQCTNLKTVTLSEGLTTIGPMAFRECSSLVNINIPNSVLTIEHDAFNSCSSLVNISIPDSVTELGGAFANCTSLESFRFPNTIKTIGQANFFNCTSLKSVIIPSTVTKIELRAFDNCDALTDVYYGGTKGEWENITIMNQNSPLESESLVFHYKSDGQPDKPPVDPDKPPVDPLDPTPTLDFKTDYTIQTLDPNGIVHFIVTATVTNRGSTTASNVTGTLTSTPQILTLAGGSVGPVNIAPGGSHTFSWPGSVANPSAKSPISESYALVFNSNNVKLYDQTHNILLKHVCVVSFDLNGGSGAISPQLVQFEEYIKRPINPTRAGYTFNGWYTQGHDKNNNLFWSDWYAHDAVNGEKVPGDGTIYAGWLSNKFVYGKDNFSFNNLNGSDPNDGFSVNTNGYEMRKDYEDILYNIESFSKNLNLIDYIFFFDDTTTALNNLKAIQNGTWDGSCFGMSSVLALIKAGKIHVNYFQAGATSPYDFNKPKNDETIKSLLNYYYLLQKEPNLLKKLESHKKDEPYNLRDLISKLNSSQYPVVLSFGIFTYNTEQDYNSGKLNEKYRTGGHTVLAYDYSVDPKTKDYLVYIWDPQDCTDIPTCNLFRVLRIKPDFSDGVFENFLNMTYDGKRRDGTGWKKSRIESALVVDEFSQYLNLEDALRASGYVHGYDKSPTLQNTKSRQMGSYTIPNYASYASNNMMTINSTESNSIMYINYPSFDIQCSDGTSAKIEYGVVKENSTLSISDAIYLNEDGFDYRAAHFVPSLNPAATYTVLPKEANSYKTGQSLSNYNTTLIMNEKSDNGFYSNVDMKGIGTITFFGNAKTTTNSNTAIDHTISIARNNFETPWNTIVTTATTKGITVEPITTKELNVFSNDNIQAKIILENAYNKIAFDNVDVDSIGVKIVNDDNDENTAVIIKSGTEQAKQTLGHTVILYTSPETPINIKSNIAHGSTAYKPADPTLEGYVFDGWYDSPDGTTLWNFDTPLTEDLRLFANWTKKDSSGSNPSDPSNPSNPSGGGYYPSMSYSISVPSVPGGKLSVNPSSASAGKQVTITATPDAGYQLNKLTVSDSKGQEIALTKNGSNQFTFKMPNGKVTIDASFVPIPAWYNPFTDVSEGAWYFDAIKYVNSNGLMNGVGDGRFAPDAGLSRAMLVQILYNKEGRPSVSGYVNSFSDVDPNSWYADAVTWAATKQITLGYDDNRFGPNDYISREQLATMLWRYFGSPSSNYTLRFDDAGQVSDYALDALKWAAEKGILNGYDNKLTPRSYATRSQVAQILLNYARI